MSLANCETAWTAIEAHNILYQPRSELTRLTTAARNCLTEAEFCGWMKGATHKEEFVMEPLAAPSPATSRPAPVFRTRLDRSGRIVLPHSVREHLQLSSGDELLVIPSGDSYRLETPDQALRAAQDYFCALVPPNVSLVDELLAERQSEVAQEATGADRDGAV